MSFNLLRFIGLLKKAVCFLPLLLIICFIGVVLIQYKDDEYFPNLLIEVSLFTMVLLALYLLVRAEMRASGLRVRTYLFLSTLVCALAAGQIAFQSRLTYPLVDWGMYTSPSGPEPFFYEFLVVHEDGQTRDLVSGWKTVRARAFYEGLARLLSDDDDSDNTDREERLAIYDSTVRALASRHEALNRKNESTFYVVAYRREIPLPGTGAVKTTPGELVRKTRIE